MPLVNPRASLVACASLVGLVGVAGAAAAEPPAPAPPVAPAVVTRALFRELARDRAKLDAVVDRAAGLVFVDHFTGAAGGPAGPAPRLLCGRPLERRLRIARRWMLDAIAREADDGGVTCRNRPGPLSGTIGGSMEYDPLIHFRFRVDPARGLVLHAITMDDEVLVAAAEVDRAHREQDRLIARLGAGACTATP
jgi:hypothetical protein